MNEENKNPKYKVEWETGGKMYNADNKVVTCGKCDKAAETFLINVDAYISLCRDHGPYSKKNLEKE